MAERSIKGDYIGFTFGGVHSSELGLVRVSNGSRYEQDLLPPLQDKKVQVAGRDGEVYFGSQYMTKPIKVPVAFDNMTEESFNQLKRLLQDKKPKYLWFDETPYKQWLVKAANVQNFKWICFDESHNGKEERIYKGEGTLEFSCFSSYAESRVTFLDEEVDDVWFWQEKDGRKRLIRETNGWYLKTIDTRQQSSKVELLKAVGSTTTASQPSHIYYKDEKMVPINFSNAKFDELSYYDNDVEVIGQYLITPQRLSISGTAAQFLIFSPGDTRTSRKGTCHVFFIKDETQFPLTINEKMFFDAYNLQNNEKAQKIALTGIVSNTNALGTEYYYYIDRTPTNETVNKTICTLLFLENDNVYWIDPKTGYPNYDIPVFCGYIKKVEQLNTLERSYNYNEWFESSHLRTQEYDNREFNIYSNQRVMVYNAGDIPTNVKLIYSANPSQDFSLSLYSNYDDDKIVGQLTLKKFDFIGEDNGFIIDSKLKLIKGTKNGILTGTVYNKYIKSGDFFKIPICNDGEYYTITSSIDQEFSVEYKHYYI